LEQGTWQFMSARLTGNMEGPHVLMDDLESSIYVLLWTALMYLECSDSTQVPSFMEYVIDPQPYHNTGGYGKTDFLQARTFLKTVKFPNRPALDKLIDDLAKMFSVRYETAPTDTERHYATKMLEQSESDLVFIEIYRLSVPYWYDMRMTSLENPTDIIELFNDALCDSLKWPSDDRAAKQHIYVIKPSPQRVIKTGWSTTFMTRGTHDDDQMQAVQSDFGVEEEEEDYQMVGVEMSSETSDSTVDSLSPTLSPGNLRR
jgi:hypothetical protein